MKTYISIFIIICFFSAIGCATKTETIGPNGVKQTITRTNASEFTSAQADAWKAYYAALQNPPVIATITQPDGAVISIKSQIPPPQPNIKQHQNQLVEPTANVLKTAVQIIGGGWAAKEILSVLSSGTKIENNGTGTVSIDQSYVNQPGSTHLTDTVIKENSDNPIDNHVENADPLVVDQEKVIVVTPEVVNPEVVIVDPSYPPVTATE